MEKGSGEQEIDLSDRLADPSTKASAVLEYILHQEDQESENQDSGEVTAIEALKERPILDRETGRQNARLAFFTTNENVLIAGTADHQAYLDLALIFDEVHVLVLLPRSGKDSFERAASNLWLYQVHGRHAWSLPRRAKEAAKAALMFNGAVRPDIIIGTDAFEAGLGALYVAREFGRPLQIHIKENFLATDFKRKRQGNWWRLWMARRALKETKSVRVMTTELLNLIKKRYPKITDLRLLPRFHNFRRLGDITPTFNLHDRYKEYVFIMLAFCPLTAESHLHDILSALRRTLLNLRIGIVVVGDGKAEALFKEKVKLLGIDKSVVFLKSTLDHESYLKSADVLIELGTDEEAEIRVLEAAASGLPAIISETEMRQDLFRDGESAFLCPLGDLECLSKKMSKFINTEALRRQFSMNAKNIAAERLHEDPDSYFRSLRATIEAVLIGEPERQGELEAINVATSHEEKTLSPNPSSG